MSKEIFVYISGRASTCSDCGSELGKGAWITLVGEKDTLCLACSDLEHLSFLPSGDAALTRRAKKHSSLSAVVMQWNKRRKRNERQGLLVDEEAIAKAEAECLADQDVRQRLRDRNAIKRETEDKHFIESFSARVRELFPGMPSGCEEVVAAHACQKYSGRVGRSASAKDLQPEAVTLAVVAHIRHTETNYDALLMAGHDRKDARVSIRAKIDAVLSQWKASSHKSPSITR